MKPRQLAIGVAIFGLAGLVYGAVQPLKRSAQNSSCQSNLKQIGNSMSQYLRDYDEKFPKADNWMDALMPYARGFGGNHESVDSVKARFACPTTGSFYAYNSQIAGQQLASIALSAPWLFEVSEGEGKTNLSDDGGLWPVSPVHQTATARGNNVYFAVYSAPARIELSEVKPNFRPFAKPTPTPKRRAKTKLKEKP